MKHDALNQNDQMEAIIEKSRQIAVMAIAIIEGEVDEADMDLYTNGIRNAAKEVGDILGNRTFDVAA
jgi:hypothetical protein